MHEHYSKIQPTYPEVLSEAMTLSMALDGMSISRFGDGELKLAYGRDCVSQRASPKLQAELRVILANDTGKALTCIPTLNPESPKFSNWKALSGRFIPLLGELKIFGSAFITRPDSAPWINTPSFFDSVEMLWRGKQLTFVGNEKRSLTSDFLLAHGARAVDLVQCSYRDSYESISDLQNAIERIGNKLVLMCAGATATCLAERLATKGFHAVDLGHIGMFWRRYKETK